VPGAVAAALLDDADAAEVATRVTAATAGRWNEAARLGLSDPRLAASAHACFTVALEALPRLGADDETRAVCADYVERFVARGRCPADDVLDLWTGAGHPAAVEPAWI
jgi:glutamate--cysteine ligase